MEKLYHLLNKQVSNFAVLFVKIHHYHWYVKGKNFYSLHQKFEDFYDEINELYDEFAERLLAIGGKPITNMKGYLQASSIQEAEDLITDESMIQALINDFKIIVDELKEGIEISQSLHDESTADLFITTITALEKHNWMLSSLLAK